jgi:hypothetical protein
MSTIQLSGSKLYRSLWVRIGKEQYEMEGRFGFPKDALTEPQRKIIDALAHGGYIEISDDGVVTPVED